MIKIDYLTAKHAPSLNRLNKNALIDHSTAFTTDISSVETRPDQQVAEHLKELENSNGFRLGAFDDAGELVGTVRLIPRRGPKLSHCADIVFLFVQSDKQNQGIGRRLLQAAIDEARQIDGLEQLELAVSRDSPVALHLYEAAGFQSTGILKRHIKVGGDYHDCITMWMPLQPTA